jgi:F-type H+-transporting ATPase subunit delta
MAFRLANRYARALADAVSDKGEYRRTLDEIEVFRGVYAESSDLREVLETPAVPMLDKTRVLNTILARLDFSLLTANFFRVLLKNYRLAQLEEIAPAFRRIAYERLGIVRVRVSSAGELSDAERQALTARFERLTGKQVVFEFHREPDLVGGLRAQIGSTVFDGSVRGALERFKEQLAAG